MRRTEGMRWTISPGIGVFPVGQFDAQKRLPKGSGMPSFASSAPHLINHHSLEESEIRAYLG